MERQLADPDGSVHPTRHGQRESAAAGSRLHVVLGFRADSFVPRSAGAKAAPDWRMELVAQAPEVRHPSVVCVAPDGRVFVAEDPMDISSAHADAKEGRIICVQPDGRRTVFGEKLHAVFGMQ